MLDQAAPVNKVKGLLKGLRYISQIFEGEKEQEMVIGLPTDVKHVAHIGWEGPTSLNSPSWMNRFHSAPLNTTFDPNRIQIVSPKSASQEIPLGGLPPPSPSRDEQPTSKPRRTRRNGSTESLGSPSRESREHSSRGSRHSRKNLSAGSVPGADSSTSEGSESSSSRRGRRHHKTDYTIGSESESPTRDLPSIPKQSRKKDKEGKKDKDKEGKKDKDKEGKREKDKEGEKDKDKESKKERRSKGSSDGGSSRSRSKNPPSSSVLSCSEEKIARPVMVQEEAF